MIASMHGNAVGFGFELALQCDVRIVGRRLRGRAARGAGRACSRPAVRARRCPRVVGTSAALMAVITGERVPAAAALARGFVDEVVPAAELRARTDELADAARGASDGRGASGQGRGVGGARPPTPGRTRARGRPRGRVARSALEGRARRLARTRRAGVHRACVREGAEAPDGGGSAGRERAGCRRARPLGLAGTEMGLVDAVARLAGRARARAIPVVHCTSAFWPDGVGSPANAPILASALRHRTSCSWVRRTWNQRSELLEPGDLRSVRFHGVAPFIGTDLDPQLRAAGVTTVVLVGGSLNVGIVGAAVEAVDLGYRVVVPRDAVVGVPTDYVAADVRAHHANARLADQRRRVAHDLVVGTARASGPSLDGCPHSRESSVRHLPVAIRRSTTSSGAACSGRCRAASTCSVPRAGERRNGMTINWVTQVSFDPKLVGVSVEREAFTHELIVDGRRLLA